MPEGVRIAVRGLRALAGDAIHRGAPSRQAREQARVVAAHLVKHAPVRPGTAHARDAVDLRVHGSVARHAADRVDLDVRRARGLLHAQQRPGRAGEADREVEDQRVIAGADAIRGGEQLFDEGGDPARGQTELEALDQPLELTVRDRGSRASASRVTSHWPVIAV